MDKSDIRICFVGDSFVNGTGDPELLGWTGRVCASATTAGYCLTHYNLGIRRDTSADVAARWVEECHRRLSTEFDSRVFFSFGVNDTVWENGALRLEREATLGHARQILTEAPRSYPCLWIGPPPVADAQHNKRIGNLCADFNSLAAELAVPYLPVFQPLLQSQIWMKEVALEDGAHPQASGYRELSRLVEDWEGWWF